MRGEFEKQIEQMKIGKDQNETILAVINSAGKEFPFLTCPSKDDCGTFKWSSIGSEKITQNRSIWCKSRIYNKIKDDVNASK